MTTVPHAEAVGNERTPGHSPTSPAPLMAPTLDERLPQIAAAIMAPEGEKMAVATAVRKLASVIAAARRANKSWSHIARGFNAFGITASADAVRMAYKRLGSSRLKAISVPHSMPDPHRPPAATPVRPVSIESKLTGAPTPNRSIVRQPSIARRAK